MNAPPKFGADGESRPHNLLFTRQLLCHLSYISKFHWGRRKRAAGSECRSLSLERLCPNVYTIRIVKELTGAIKKTPVVTNLPGFSLGASLEGSMFEPSENNS